MSGAKVKARHKRDLGVVPAGVSILLSKEQIYAAIGVSDRTFDSMLSAGKYPPPDMRLGPLPRWKVETHNKWVEASCGFKEN